MLKKISSVGRSEFVRNLMTLMMGASIAQAIPLAASPILTRIYSPEEFGILAVYLSLASIVAVVATARYELAIVQPAREDDAAAIVVLSILVATFISVILLLIVFLYNSELCRILGSDDISGWLYFLPLSTFSAGVYQSLNYWSVRSKNFRLIASSSICQGVVTPSIQTGFGFFSITGGLIFGNLAGAFSSMLLLCKRITAADRKAFKNVTVDKIKINGRRYSRFPKYSLVGAIADSSSQQMPVFFITRIFDTYLTGLYSLTMRVISLPLLLVSRSLSQVVLQKITELHHSSPFEIRILIVKLFIGLILTTIPLILVISLFGGELFSFVFGEPWRKAGELGEILVFALAIRFAVSPLSGVLSLERNIRLGVTWQIMYIVTIMLTLYLLSNYELEIFIIGFVIHELVLYTLYLLFILKGATYSMENNR